MNLENLAYIAAGLSIGVAFAIHKNAGVVKSPEEIAADKKMATGLIGMSLAGILLIGMLGKEEMPETV